MANTSQRLQNIELLGSGPVDARWIHVVTWMPLICDKMDWDNGPATFPACKNNTSQKMWYIWSIIFFFALVRCKTWIISIEGAKRHETTTWVIPHSPDLIKPTQIWHIIISIYNQSSLEDSLQLPSSSLSRPTSLAWSALISSASNPHLMEMIYDSWWNRGVDERENTRDP